MVIGSVICLGSVVMICDIYDDMMLFLLCFNGVNSLGLEVIVIGVDDIINIVIVINELV